jgi:uncharacterized protein YjbI with pentapeptide repeats
VLLALLIVFFIVLLFFAESVAAFLFVGGDIPKRAVLWGIRTMAVLAVLVALWRLIRIGYDYKWTGLGAAELPKHEKVEFRPEKTLWDWLQLLIVPFALVVISFLFTTQQDARQQQIESRRAQQAQEIENQRAEAERELAEQRAQDDALQSYLDQMSGLLLGKNLRASEEDSEVRTLARARTLTVLSRLDPSRKADVIQFLIEAELVQRVEGTGPIINLSGVNLSGADLSGADLSDVVDLNGADLSDANLLGADLRAADLSDADLSDADLSDANLSDADLSDAKMFAPNLEGASLEGANLEGVTGVTIGILELQAASLEGATMPDGSNHP